MLLGSSSESQRTFSSARASGILRYATPGTNRLVVVAVFPMVLVDERRSAMTLLEFFLLLIIAGVCGSLAQAIAGYTHGGCLVSIVLGLIGALLGTWLARALGIGEFLNIQVGDRP